MLRALGRPAPLARPLLLPYLAVTRGKRQEINGERANEEENHEQLATAADAVGQLRPSPGRDGPGAGGLGGGGAAQPGAGARLPAGERLGGPRHLPDRGGGTGPDAGAGPRVGDAQEPADHPGRPRRRGARQGPLAPPRAWLRPLPARAEAAGPRGRRQGGGQAGERPAAADAAQGGGGPAAQD